MVLKKIMLVHGGWPGEKGVTDGLSLHANAPALTIDALIFVDEKYMLCPYSDEMYDFMSYPAVKHSR